MPSFAIRYASIQDRIAAAARRAGRNPEEITLVVVSKTQPLDRLWEAYEAGVRNFGENRVQEAIPKFDALPPDITWHLIGSLQSNKAKLAAERFSAIHSLENERQLAEITKANRRIDGLIQVNLGEEAQKSGILGPELDAFRKIVLQYDQVVFRGLMTIGPAHQSAEEARILFRTLRELGKAIGTPWLSMGMSDDFEVAVEEGSTHVRIGSALFGPRSTE